MDLMIEAGCTIYTIPCLPITTTRVWQVREAEDLRKKFVTDTYVVKGVLHWKANNAIVPPHVYKDAFCECPAVQVAAYNADMDRFATEYRKRQAAHRPTADERAEMDYELRAAFGSGTTVVDVITGRKTKVR